MALVADLNHWIHVTFALYVINVYYLNAILSTYA
jgi:hypothetical protein